MCKWIYVYEWEGKPGKTCTRSAVTSNRNFSYANDSDNNVQQMDTHDGNVWQYRSFAFVFFLAPSRARKQYRLPWSIAVQWCGCNILLLLLLCEMSLFSHISAQSYAKMYVGVQRREGRQLQATLLLLVNLLVCISRCCQIILCNLFIPLWYAIYLFCFYAFYNN